MTRRREPTDLCATILEVVRTYEGEARVTRISYGAGMPVDRLKPLLARLIAAGLLRARADEDRTCYEITPRGHEFLTVYWKLKGFTESLDPGRRRPPGFDG